VNAAWSVDLGRGLRLVLPACRGAGGGYPTDSLAKAPILAMRGLDLAEEGVGFGLPVVRGRLDTVFPGSLELVRRDEDGLGLAIDFTMDLVERIARTRSNRLEGGILHVFKEFFGFVHRELPFTRRALTTLSNRLRIALRMETRFARGESLGKLRVEYRVEPGRGRIAIAANGGGLSLGEGMRMILMNEGGARRFDLYEDSEGTRLVGGRIETWRQVEAKKATFRDEGSGVFFSAHGRPGARLFRGRELVEDRLSWAGLAFVLPVGQLAFDYEMEAGVRP
jgi:hypothetical protein